jgi:predicted dehydrogenase
MERFGIKRLLRTQSSRHSNASTSQAAPTALADLPPPRPPFSAHPPRVLIIGAGSRGNAYACAIMLSSNGLVAAVAEPVEHKRVQFGRKHIWGIDASKEGMEFPGWEEFIAWEVKRRERKAKGEEVPDGVDGVIVCTLDETHADVIVALAPLNLHILAEKPLATNLDACLRIYESLLPPEGGKPTALFAIGHVLRYSPHNIMLRKLLLEDEVIGDVVSVEHVEPVGWWHFAHSYVRYSHLHSL